MAFTIFSLLATCSQLHEIVIQLLSTPFGITTYRFPNTNGHSGHPLCRIFIPCEELWKVEVSQMSPAHMFLFRFNSFSTLQTGPRLCWCLSFLPLHKIQILMVLSVASSVRLVGINIQRETCKADIKLLNHTCIVHPMNVKICNITACLTRQVAQHIRVCGPCKHNLNKTEYPPLSIYITQHINEMQTFGYLWISKLRHKRSPPSEYTPKNLFMLVYSLACPLSSRHVTCIPRRSYLSRYPSRLQTVFGKYFWHVPSFMHAAEGLLEWMHSL